MPYAIFLEFFHVCVWLPVSFLWLVTIILGPTFFPQNITNTSPPPPCNVYWSWMLLNSSLINDLFIHLDAWRIMSSVLKLNNLTRSKLLIVLYKFPPKHYVPLWAKDLTVSPLQGLPLLYSWTCFLFNVLGSVFELLQLSLCWFILSFLQIRHLNCFSLFVFFLWNYCVVSNPLFYIRNLISYSFQIIY